MKIRNFMRRLRRRTESGRFNFRVTNEGCIRSSWNRNPIIALASDVTDVSGNTPETNTVVAGNWLGLSDEDARLIAEAANTFSPAQHRVAQVRQSLMRACGLNN